MRKLKLFLTLLMLMCIGVTQMWGTVVSGTAYDTKTVMPTGWTEGGSEYVTSGGGFKKLTESNYFIQTDEFCQNGFTSIAISARKYGTVTGGKEVITVEWVENGSDPVVLGTISPTSTSITSYSITSPASVTGNKSGKIKISNKNASSGGGAGVQTVTITYTAGTCSAPAADPVTVTLMDKNAALTEETAGAGVTLPSRDKCGDYEFAGWAKASVDAETTTAPTIIPAGAYSPEADENLYPVYTRVVEGSGSGGSTTKSMTSFSELSGDVDGDENVSYEAAKGNAGTAPAVNGGEIRIYQNGGLLTITAKNGKKLTSITIGSSMGTTVTYAIDGGTASSNQSISANGTFPLNDIEATSVVFTCTGTSKTTRLYLNSLSVTYSGGGSSSTTYYLSAPSCSTPDPACTKLDTPVVAVPTGYTRDSVRLTWGAVENAAKYVVKFNGEDHETTNRYYDATGLTANTQYSYQVKAVAAANQTTYCDGDFSKLANFTTLPAPAVTVDPASWDFGTVATDSVISKEFSVSGTNLDAGDLTITVSDGYSVDKAKITMESAGTLATTSVTVSKNTQTVGSNNGYMVISGCGLATNDTVALTMTVAEKYTVKFSTGAGNPAQADIKETAPGAGISLPTGPTPKCVADGWVFAGWKETSAVEEETTTAPTLLAAGTNYKPAANCTLFAVYKRTEEGGTSVWAKMTSNPQVGDAVLLVNENAKVEAKDKSETKYITVEEYETTPSGLLPWTIEAGNSEGSFSFKNGDDYLNLPSASNELRRSTDKTNNSSWTISVANDGTATITNVAYTARVIKFNSGSPRFACYESGQQAIQLYKQAPGSTIYYLSAPACCDKHAITIASGIENGTVSADPTSACEGATVTLTFTPAGSYHLESWSIDGKAQKVNENTFAMPDSAVVISATFTHDECQNLAAPASVSIDSTYNSATITWGEVANASSYMLTVIDTLAKDTIIFNESVNALSKALSGLKANTKYNYSIMAVGDTINYCAEGNPTLDSVFTTAALPQVKLTLMVGGVEDERSANHAIQTPFNLPDSAAVEGCPKVFVGWSKDAARATEPEYAPGVEFTFDTETPDTLYAVFATAGAGAAVTYPIDFEAEAASYTTWVFDNMTSYYTTSGITAHGGSKMGSTGGKATASVTTAAKIANPTSITFYVSKQSTNTTASSWKVEVSADGETWATVGDEQSATSMSKGVWVEVTRDLSEYSDVYVRVYYGSNTAVRLIDDLVLSAVGPASYSEYSTECEACKTVTLKKDGEAGDNNFALKIGNDTVTSVQTCAAAKVAIVPTVATGYEVSFAISELEGATLVGDTINLAANTNGTLNVTATFSQINYSVTMDQEGGANAELSADQSKHYGDTITISTKVPDGYVFTGWTFKPAVTFIENYDATKDTTKFSMPDSAVTATAHFGKVYKVSFNTGDPITEASIGAGVTLPAGPALSDACVADGWSFAGWATDSVAEETTTAPTTLYEAFTIFNPTKDTTLYAVYKRSVEGGSPVTKYVKTALTDIESGSEVVITELYNEKIYAAANDGGTSAGPSEVELTETENVLNVGNNSNIFWTIAKEEDNFSFAVKGGTDKLYCTNTNNGVRVGTNENNVFSINNNYLYNNATSRYVGYNHESGGLFRCYTSINSNINKETLAFYMATQVVPTTDYYITTPNCCTKHGIGIASGIENGSVTADLAKACADSTVTLTFTPAANYHLSSWSVNGTAKDSTENTFVMPDDSVTISATFAEDKCAPLSKPVVTVSDTVYPYNAVKLAWTAIEHADKYKVYIYDKNNVELEHNDTLAGVVYTIDTTLSASKTYKYSVQAISNSPAVYCPSDSAKGSFKTDTLPAATLTLSENGAEYNLAGEHSLTEVVTLPDTLHFAGCNGKVLVGWSSVAIAEPGDKPTANYWAAGANNYAISAANDTLYAVYATENAGEVTTKFSETFDDCNGTGGNDGSWSGSIASGTLTADNKGWLFSNGNGANECAKFGTTSKKGSAQTPAIEVTGAATLTFKAGAWNSNSEGTTLNVTATGATLANGSVTLTKGAWKTYTIAISNATGSVQIKFEAQNANNNRFFLDDVVVSQSAISYSEYTTSCTALLAAPTFSPAAQEAAFTTAQTVMLSAKEGTIYYTLDGSDPTNESTEYTAPIILDKCGTHTIKAIAISSTNHSAIASATYEIAIEQQTSSADAPFTPTQAIGLFDSNCYNSELVYVKGVVKTSSGLNTTYGNYDNIVVVAADTTAPEFTFFHMYKGAEKVQFEATDPAIVAGDTIVAYGELTKYNDIYEFKDGCYLIDRKAYTAPKEHIANDLEGAYTLAQAMNFLDNPTTYDLSDTVYVKGVANGAPNEQGTFTAHDPEEENSFQFYNTNQNNLTIGAKDTVIVKGIIRKVNANYRMEAGVAQQVKAYVAHTIAANPTAVAFGSVEQNESVNAIPVNVYLTNVANATVTLADENNVFSINKTALTENDVITVSATTTAAVGEYAATITISDDANVADDVIVNVTMTIIEPDGRKKAQDLDGFEALNGNLNADIAFASAQGDGTVTPALNDGKILYYQPASGKAAGGYMTLTAVKGCTIDQVKVVTANNDTKIKYSKDGGDLSEATEVTAGGEYLTPASLGAQTVNIYCAGADKNHRLYVAQVVVYYTGEAKAVDHYTVDTTAVVTKEFKKNAPFSSAGLKVYACYETDESDNVDITADCHVMADLTSIGQKMAEVYLGEQKLGDYHINVIAGQDDPKLAYTPASQILEAAEVGTWSAPIFKNDSNVSPISFISDNEAVATVDENGVVALAGGYGTAVITASFAETEDYIASVATYTLTINEPKNKIEGKWLMATAADIKPGIKVIVVGEKNNIKYAMGAQNTNNRAAVARESIVADTLYAAEGTKTFTLVDAGNGLYAFKANNGKYLFAASGSNNYLKEQATIDGNASWKISIAGNGEATIKAQGSNSRNWMSMVLNGQNPPLFSSYKEKQSAIALYVNRTVIAGNDDPTAEPDSVVISGNVTEEEIVASGNVVVEVTQNFEEPKSYIAQNGATIIINNSGDSTEAKSVIADSTSTIKVTKPTTVNKTFSVAATMGGGVSGQIAGSDLVTIAQSTDAYFDITLGDNANPEHWHAIAVPFPVDVINGIYDAVTGDKLENEKNYAIMEYHGDLRAQGLYGWKKIRTTLMPGVFYLMTVDGDTKTFRFKMAGTVLPTGENLQLSLHKYAVSTGIDGTNGGWNGVANPTLEHGMINKRVQVLDPATYTYKTILAKDTNFVVGTPFFIQSGAEETVLMEEADPTKPYYAPKRVAENKLEEIKVTFGNEQYTDKLYISASEDATNEYQIGKDLAKMSMTATPKVAQICGNAYGTDLSIIDAPMVNDKAEYSLTLYAPNAGEYTISAPQMDNADLYLTYNGSIIWNLSTSEYTNDFEKGNNEGYGLLLVKKIAGMATGCESIEAQKTGVQKIVIDDKVFILRAGQMYDVTGKMVK